MSEPASVSYFTPTYYEGADWVANPPGAPIVVAGGGPVGLVTALGLARRGVPVTVVEQKNRVGLGSKAAALTSRSLEILAALDVAEPFLKKGLPWDSGRSFYRGKEISRFRIPWPPERQHPSLVNMPQPFMEQFLVDACLDEPLVDIRWESEVRNVADDGDEVRLTIGTPGGEVVHSAQWVVAADGARSAVRKALGVRLEGTTYTNSFVICDLRMNPARGTQRLCWFDPPAFAGRTVLLHQLTDGLWRLDYQISEEEDQKAAIDPEVVAPLVRAHFDYIGEEAAWEIEWLSLYRAHARVVDAFRKGRVLFAGDAAHILPVFGVRGLNSGLADSSNLAWKLALVVRGDAPAALLDTYDWEQRDFFEQNRAYADHSTRYMTPGTQGTQLVRDASLSLALVEPALEFLADPSYATPLDWSEGPLVREDADDWSDGVPSGGLVPNVALSDGGPHLNDVAGPWFSLVTVDTNPPVGTSMLLTAHPTDADSPVGRVLGGVSGSAYLLRPDRHVLRRWADVGAPGFVAELRDEMQRLGIDPMSVKER